MHETESSATDSSSQNVFNGGSAETLLASMPSRLAGLVERQAMTAPDRSALISAGKTVTYSDLWQAIGRAKELLKAAGVVGGDRVMIVNENSIAAVTFIFAAISTHGRVLSMLECRREKSTHAAHTAGAVPLSIQLATHRLRRITPRRHTLDRTKILFLAKSPSGPRTRTHNLKQFTQTRNARLPFCCSRRAPQARRKA
jgi:non-ribosomal peptide synthetase component E (peptide arylation enzyme)